MDQVLKMSSEGSTVHREVTPPFVEGTIVSGSGSSQIRWKRPSRAPDLSLVLDRIEDVMMGTLNWTRSSSTSLPLLDLIACLAGLWIAEES